MDDNPYKAPESSADVASVVEKPRQPIFRTGRTLGLAILCNVPLLVITYLEFCSVISVRSEHLAMAGWEVTIAVGAMLTAHVPFLQRWMFVPDAEFHRYRPGLWAFAGIWILIASTTLVNVWLEY